MPFDTSHYEYARCRAVGHAWDLIPNTRRPPWGKLLTFRCTGCGMVREDIVDQLFQLSSRRYIRPEGYKAPKASRADWMSGYVKSEVRQRRRSARAAKS